MDKKKILKLAKLADEGNDALIQYLFELDDNIEAVSQSISKSISDIKTEIRTSNDSISETNRKFEDIKPTDERLVELIKPLIPEIKDGATPTKEELLALIKPLIPKVKDGETPTKEMLLDIILPLIPSIDHEAIKEYILSIVPKTEDLVKGVAEQVEKKIPELGIPIRDSLEKLPKGEWLSKDFISGLEDYDEISSLAREPRIIKKFYGGGGGSSEGGGGGASAFTDLTDTFASYTGLAGKGLRVNGTETGIDTYTPTDTDEKVKLNASDPTAGYLDDKITGYGFLTTETDTLDTVTDRGATTTNDITVNSVTETVPTLLKLDQTTPQTFTNLGGGTGLMKVTAGVLGLDTNTYLTAETDPVYTGSSWYTTTNNAGNWDTAYGWGNHASAGYAYSSDLSAYAKLDGSNHPFTYVKTPKIYPASDSPTALQILKADGTTSVMNFDTTNGYIGIGTTSPTEQLHLMTESNIGLGFRNASNTATQRAIFIGERARGTLASPLAVQDADNISGWIGKAYINGDYRANTSVEFVVNGTPSATSYPSAITFSTTNSATTARTEKMRLTNDGRLGLGTTTPSLTGYDTRLHVYGTNSGATNRTAVVVENKQTDAGAILITRNNVGSAAYFQSFGSAAHVGDTYGLNGQQSLGATKGLVILTNGEVASGGTDSFSIRTGGYNLAQERMRITSAGNVGIGTTAPLTQFEVSGTTGGLTLTRTSDVVADEPFVLLRKNATPTNIAQIRGIHGGGLRFTNGASDVEWARITSAGNVGIGTTAPAGTLEVASSPVGTQCYITKFGDDASGSYAILQKTRGANATTLTATQNNDFLGIFQFNGVNTSSARAISARIIVQQTAAAGSTWVPANMQFRTASSSAENTVMTLTSDNRVGIGVTTAGAKLQVETLTTETISPIIAVRALTATTGIFVSGQFAAKTTGVAGATFGPLIAFTTTDSGSSTNGGYVASLQETATRGTNALTFATSTTGTNAEKMRITSAGNVGIGTTVPAAYGGTTLEVSNDTVSRIFVTQANNDAVSGAFTGKKSRGTVASPTIVQNGDQVFSLAASAYDGVAYSQGASILFNVDSVPVSGQRPSSRLTFHTNINNTASAERMRIDSAGYVGIGTTAPAARLHSLATTEQLRLGYDASNYMSATVGSAGSITFALTGTTPKFTFSQAVKLSTLTSGRIPFATTGGELIDDSDLTFATDTLTATKIVGTTSVKVGTAGGFISSDGSTGATGSFTTADLKTVTVKDGIITSIV